jgi:hypothetical protein
MSAIVWSIASRMTSVSLSLPCSLGGAIAADYPGGASQNPLRPNIPGATRSEIGGRAARRIRRRLAKLLREYSFESVSCAASMFDAVDEAAIGVEREAWVGVAELPTDVDHVQALRDQQRRVRMPQIVEAQ